ncbi:unnamed protein product [Peronospora farinosa]|uniref:Uncharacterized protein n=1 Tax=Peronospora farinosa TaxID=134698 RepID=A0AAV0SYT1_9STRA|nr:unnamed protein product [Peronospora farinosa]CAI5710765.1 unnamed protein product [Peronospora farinosa]
MRKSSVLIGVLSSTTIQAQNGEFHGLAARLTDTTDADFYTFMSCAQPEGARCVGQCVEVWCENCLLGSRPILRVADRCAACESGDLFLSRDIFQQLLGTNTSMSFSVQWRCVDCGMIVGNKQVAGERIHPDSEGRVHATQALDSTNDLVAHQSIKDGALACSLAGQKIARSSDTKVKIPPVDTSEKSNGEGMSDTSSGGDFSSGSESMAGDVKWEDVQREKVTVLPMPTPPSSSLSNSTNGASTPPVPSTKASSSSSSIFDGTSSSDGAGSSLSSSVNPSYSVEKIPFDNSQDALASSSLSGTDNQPPISTPTLSPYQMSDDSVDNSLSATSSVTKSPFFYASIMLGIVGLIGATVGYRAKQKRSYRNERRAFRMFAQTGINVSNPLLASSVMAAQTSRTRPDSHTIAIL